MYACVYAAGHDDQRRAAALAENSVQKEFCDLRGSALIVVAQQFSPRYESRRDLVVIDVRGLERLFGTPRAIGDELRREAADRGLRAHVAIAPTQTAAIMLAISRPGVVVIERDHEAEAMAPLPIDVLCRAGLLGPRSADDDGDPDQPSLKLRRSAEALAEAERVALHSIRRWGIRTIGEFARLPADELVSRMGKPALVWHALANGRDLRPLVPDIEDERFDAALDLEWPIEGLEPLSFVLTRLLEPLSLRLEQRDRGVAVLHVQLRLVMINSEKATHARRLELPAPMRDVKTLRTLALLDLEAHPPPGDNVAIDRVTIVIEPTPGRVLQHTLFARPHPTPEQLSTLLARLGAAMGQDRVGAPVMIDSYRPGAFEMKPFATDHNDQRRAAESAKNSFQKVVRRCRQPVPARVVVADNRPVKVTSDRRSFAGGNVLSASGPWKTSGEWWTNGWDRDEWDVSLSDGAAYRVFLDRASGGWFIDAILD